MITSIFFIGENIGQSRIGDDELNDSAVMVLVIALLECYQVFFGALVLILTPDQQLPSSTGAVAGCRIHPPAQIWCSYWYYFSRDTQLGVRFLEHQR